LKLKIKRLKIPNIPFSGGDGRSPGRECGNHVIFIADEAAGNNGNRVFRTQFGDDFWGKSRKHLNEIGNALFNMTAGIVKGDGIDQKKSA